MTLPDRTIERMARTTGMITPFDRSRLQPASYDMTLDRFFRFYGGRQVLDVKSPERRTTMIEVEESFELGPQNFVLASTVERLNMPGQLAARIEGKSSLARMGLFVHVTAGFIDPGFEGTVTLELFNGNHLPIKMYVGMPICQVAFDRLDTASDRKYGQNGLGSKYQGQAQGPVESMYYRNFQDE